MRLPANEGGEHHSVNRLQLSNLHYGYWPGCLHDLCNIKNPPAPYLDDTRHPQRNFTRMKRILALALFLGTISMSWSIPVDLLHCEFSRTSPPNMALSATPMDLTRTPLGWLVKIPQKGTTEPLRLPHDPWIRPRPVAVVLRAETLRGKAKFRLNMVDGHGRWYATGWQELTPGQDRIVVPLEGMPEGKGTCRLMNMVIDTEVTDSELLLKRLDVIFNRPAMEAVQWVMDTGDGMLPFYTNAPSFILRNSSDTPVTRQEKITFTDMYGSHYDVASDVNLAPYSEIRLTPPQTPPHNGVWYGPATDLAPRVMFALVPENGLATPPNAEFEFAVDNHWINPAVVEAMRYLGIRAARTLVGWERIQPEGPDDWNFRAFDERLEALSAVGIKMRDTLVFTPAWAAVDNPQKRRFPRNRRPRQEFWENYVRAMVERYGDKVEFFELWNEPDLTGFVDFPVEEYIELCRSARRIAREVNPRLKLASGGFATMSPSLENGAPARFHEEVLRQAKDTFDIHSYHEHGYFPHYQLMVDRYFLPLRERHGIAAPWLASETAMHSASGTDFEQADCLFKKLLFSWARGAVSYTWYGLCNNGYDLKYSEDNFGILDRFMSPKYIFAVYAAIIREYQTAKYQGQIQSPGDPWLFAFRSPEAVLLANWALTNSSASTIYAAYSDGSSATQLDLAGNGSDRPTRHGVALFTVAGYGSTLVLQGATVVDKVKPVAVLDVPEAVFLNATSSGKLTLSNPWNETVTGSISPRVATGQRITGLPEDITLIANETRELPFALFCSQGAARLAMLCQFDTHPPLEIVAPLKTATLSPNADFQQRSADFVLDQYSQLVSTFEFDPTRAATLWHGETDLSAKVWVGRQMDTLLIRAEVQDDHHCFSPEAANIWKGDSIQFALGIRGQNGHFELGAALDGHGQAVPDAWIAPEGFSLADLRQAMGLAVEREGSITTYRLSLPIATMRVTPDHLQKGFRINFLVNDNDDGVQRKCFIRLAPGIGSTQTMDESPMVICQ